MSIVQVVPLHTNIISIKLILYTNVEKQDEGFITLQGHGGSGRPSLVEVAGSPARRSLLRWALGTTDSCRGCRTSYSAAGPLMGTRDGRLTSRLQDLRCSGWRPSPAWRAAGLLRGGRQSTYPRWRATASPGRRQGEVESCSGAVARRVGRLLGRRRQEHYGSRTPLCCEVERQESCSVWGKGTQWQSLCKYVQRVRGGSTIEVVNRCEYKTVAIAQFG
jgi:hypothetical protein